MNPFERALGLAAGMTDNELRQQDMHRAALQSVQLQALQTRLLNQMSSTMGSIHTEVAQARQQQQEALAIQQKLLAQEELQTWLEEMIYQTEKLIAECSKGDKDTPASTWYFLLDAVLRQIEQDGIGTPIIKGRDNKAAFERVVKEANELVQQLRKDNEVQQAIAWAKKLEDQRQRKREELEQKAAPLRAQVAALQEERGTPISVKQTAITMFERVKSWIPAKHRTLALVLLAPFTCLLPFLLPVIPLMFLGVWIDRSRLTQERNAKLDKEIARLEEKIGVLLAEK